MKSLHSGLASQTNCANRTLNQHRSRLKLTCPPSLLKTCYQRINRPMSKDMINLEESVGPTMRELIHPFLKPTLTENDELLSNITHFGRNRITQVLSRSTDKLAQLGVRPQPVQTKILVPMLNACALEDDEDMLEIWENLLASSACENSVPPVFVRILSTLSSEEARLLSALKRLQITLPNKSRPCVKVMEFRLSSMATAEAFHRCILSLFQLGLVEVIFDTKLGAYPHKPPIQDINFICTTPFADEFLKACTQPSEKS